MKKLAFICMALLISGVAKAQIQKGDIQLGLALNFSEQGFVSNKTNVKRLHTSGALFLSDRLSAGVMLGYRNTVISTFASTDDNLADQVFQFGIYSRYHHPISKNLYLFFQPSILVGTGNTDLSLTNTADYNTLYLQLSPGITYFFAERWALELSFSGLRHTQTRQKGATVDQTLQDSDFSINLNNISVGLSFYLKK